MTISSSLDAYASTKAAFVPSVELLTVGVKPKLVEHSFPVSRLEYQTSHNLVQCAMKKGGGKQGERKVISLTFDVPQLV